MRKHLQLLIVASAALFLLSAGSIAMTGADNSQSQGAGLMADLGAADFRTYCAACHGVEARGDGTVAEFLTIAAADLTQLAKKNGGIFPRERITGLIDGREEVKVHGPRDMPVWGDWFNAEATDASTTPEERDATVAARIKALVDYIETIQE
jgi:mono/diheme cytochrome c family protein